MKRIATLASLLVIFAHLAYPQPSFQTSSATQIMEKTFEVYASCRSYEDEGEVRTVFIEEIGRRTIIKPFSTAFSKPSGFRYEFRARRGDEDWDSYIIAMQEEVVKTWWSLKPEIETSRDLSRALAGATGVSSGSAYTIPFLLMPSLGKNRRLDLTELQLNGVEAVSGRTAYKIEGKNFQGRTTTVWIDRERLLILKIFDTAEFPDKHFKTETTTSYSPQVNVMIAPEKLAFNPPFTR